MSYDLLVGMNAGKLNQAISQIYTNNNIRQNLFKGSQSGNYSGTAYSLNWDVQSAPQVELRPPTADEWSNSIKGDGTVAAPSDNAFIVNLPQLAIDLQANPPLKTTVPVKAICVAKAQGSSLSITSLAVIINISGASDFDKYLIRYILVPAVLNVVNKTLRGLNIPAPSFGGISLTPPAVNVQNGYLLMSFNLVQSGAPSFGGNIPNDPFFILMSPQLCQFAANYGVKNLVQGKNFSSGGSKGGGGFSASYSVVAVVNNASVSTTPDPTTLNAGISLSMSASAGIDLPLNYIIQGGQVVVNAIVDAGKTVVHVLNPSNW